MSQSLVMSLGALQNLAARAEREALVLFDATEDEPSDRHVFLAGARVALAQLIALYEATNKSTATLDMCSAAE